MLTTAVAMAVATVLLLAAANGADVRRNHAPDGCFDRCARPEPCPLPLQGVVVSRSLSLYFVSAFAKQANA